MQAWVRALGAMKAIEGQPDITLTSLVREAANGRPDAIALIDRDGQFTYRELEDRSTYYMEWAIAQGVTAGDRVGLLMPNCRDYVAIWFGITQAGGVVALLNTNLVGAGLAHCIEAAAATHLIVAAEMMDRVRAVNVATGKPAAMLGAWFVLRCWHPADRRESRRRGAQPGATPPVQRRATRPC